MSNDRPSDVLGALPRRRPQRRSEKRPVPPPVEGAATSQPAPTRRKQPRSAATPKPRSVATSQPRSAAPATPTPASTGRAAGTDRPSAQVLPARTRATRRRPERLPQPAQPPGVPPTPPASRPEQPGNRRILGTAAQAAAELAEIGLTASARALRNAVARLPRP